MSVVKTKSRTAALRLLAGAAILFAGPLFAADPATNRVVEPFTVTATPLKLYVKSNEVFKVSLKIANPTAKPQTIYLWSCNWDWNWKSSNPSVVIPGWGCRENVPLVSEMKPGSAYERDVEMVIRGPVTPGLVKFRMGLTPIDPRSKDSSARFLGSQTYWSNEVVIELSSQ